MVHLHPAFERDDRRHPPVDVEEEEIDGTSLGGDLQRIEGVPVFVRGMARGHIVRAVRVLGDDRLWSRGRWSHPTTGRRAFFLGVLRKVGAVAQEWRFLEAPRPGGGGELPRAKR